MKLSIKPKKKKKKTANFNYRNLESAEFEALAKDVMERLLGRSLYRYGQGKDGGIDLCDDIREKYIDVQCKKFLYQLKKSYINKVYNERHKCKNT